MSYLERGVHSSLVLLFCLHIIIVNGGWGSFDPRVSLEGKLRNCEEICEENYVDKRANYCVLCCFASLC